MKQLFVDICGVKFNIGTHCYVSNLNMTQCYIKYLIPIKCYYKLMKKILKIMLEVLHFLTINYEYKKYH